MPKCIPELNVSLFNTEKPYSYMHFIMNAKHSHYLHLATVTSSFSHADLLP